MTPEDKAALNRLRALAWWIIRVWYARDPDAVESYLKANPHHTKIRDYLHKDFLSRRHQP